MCLSQMNPSSQIVVVSVGIRGAIGATTYAASAGLAKRPAPIKRAARREPPVVIEGNTQLTGCEGDTVLCFCTINRAFRAGYCDGVGFFVSKAAAHSKGEGGCHSDGQSGKK